MHSERVDGYNPLAVADAIKRKKALLEQGDGPVLLETITYRYSGHSPSDASSYRIKEEIEAWQAIDPLEAYAKEIIDAGLVTADQIDQRKAETTKVMTQACRLASCFETSPRLPSEKIAGLMFSKPARWKTTILPVLPNLFYRPQKTHGFRHWRKNPEPELLMENQFPKNKVYQYRDAIFEAAFHRFRMIPLWLHTGKKTVTGEERLLATWIDRVPSIPPSFQLSHFRSRDCGLRRWICVAGRPCVGRIDVL